MADLKNIQGLGEGSAELLGALGIEQVSTLAQSDPGELLGEMEQANARFKVADQLPSLDELIAWIEECRKIEGYDGPPLVQRLNEVVELVPIEVLTALPVMGENLVKNKIQVGDVPIMEEFLEESELYVEQPRSLDAPVPESKSVREISTKPVERVVKNNPLPEDHEKRERVEVKPLDRKRGFDIRKTASPELNAGKKLHSRAYVRGVLHPQPFRVKLAAIFSAVTLSLFPLVFIAGSLVLLFKDNDQVLWFAAVPVAFLFFGFFYVVYSRPLKCRICGQPLFVPKRCGRHVKAHRIPLLGYILPTSLHMLIFHWFRCIYCGTSVRLKE